MSFPAKVELLVQFGRDRRVPRVQRPAGPVGDDVEIRVGLGRELGLAALQQGRARGGVDLWYFFFFEVEVEVEFFFSFRRCVIRVFRASLASLLSFPRFSNMLSRSCSPQIGPGASRPGVI